MFLKELLGRIFIIRLCGACLGILDYEDRNDVLCPKCADRYRKAKIESCPVCSQSAVECLCMPKPLKRRGALCLRKLYFYDAKRHRDAQNRIIYNLKKYPDDRLARFMAKELYVPLRQELEILAATAENTVIVSIPRSNRARRRYGVDQSAFICERLSEECGIPHIAAIRRGSGGKAQKKLARSKRFKNTKALFSISDPSAVAGRFVILFDDVVTSGATMSACVEILKKAGASGIICLCMAQVAENSVK